MNGAIYSQPIKEKMMARTTSVLLFLSLSSKTKPKGTTE